jgi:hypothetical protein
MLEAGWHRVLKAVRRSSDVTEIRRHGEGDVADGRGPHGSDVRERGVVVGMCKVEGNTPFGKYVKATQAEWAERGPGGIRGKGG